MNLPALSGYALWLLPDRSSGRLIGKQIEKLSKLFSSHSFYPHITIGKVPDLNEKQLSTALVQIASGIRCFKIKLNNVECRDHPFQKLIVSTINPPLFAECANSIDQTLNGAFGKRDDHHISLLYSDLNCSELVQIEEILKPKLPAVVKMNRIVLVHLQGLPDEWNIVKACELKS